MKNCVNGKDLIKKISSKDIRKVFIRSNLLQGSWNFERMQALGFCFSMIPIIRRLYFGKERIKAIKRHLEFFNTHPYIAAPILGVVIAMEEKRANGISIDDSAISSVKIGMMGPLAGIGDPIFWGTIRPIFAALGAGIALNGNILGPIIFFLLFNFVRLSFRYYGIIYGYKKGLDLIQDMTDNLLLKKINEGASIIGLFIMGALVNKWTRINIPLVISKFTDSNGITTTTTIQNILDQLMPGIIPLLLTFSCMFMLKRKINTLAIIFSFFLIGIFGYWIGIFSA